MRFNHVKNFIFPEMGVTTTDAGRYYVTPEGNKYPSVTTVISKGTDQTWKEEWIARVGKEEAERISKKATVRGESVHEIVEKYLGNDPEYKKGKNPFDIESFNNIKHLLDNHIGDIERLEVPLYSDFLRVAGRVDCIAQWDGIWSIVDFKTSKKQKSREQVFHYMCQESAYSYMFFERTGKAIPQIVTVITVDEDAPQVYVERAKNYLPHFINIRKNVSM